MIDTFAAMPIEVRKTQRKQYRAFLAERDGEVDYGRRMLTRREARMRKYEQPLSRLRSIDAQTFAKQYERFDAGRRSSPEMLLLLALVKVNAAEAFGVSKTFGKAMKRAIVDHDDVESLLLIEETYHTRMLLSSACLYGIDVNAAYTPPSALRVLIGGIAHTPESLSRPLVLAKALGSIAPEMQLLGVMSDDPLADLPKIADPARLPEVVRRQAFFA